ncbi:GNAT family N-acetyltransferase, partial [Phocaeicola vulgatus]
MLCVFSIFDYFCWYHLILDSMVYIETPHLLLR